MDWLSAPIGMIRRDELLNALLAIWKTQYSLTQQNMFNEISPGYQIGFEEGLDSIAQIAGLTEFFEAGKVAHRAKIKAKLNLALEVIDSRATLLD